MSNKVGETIGNRVEWGRWVGASEETHGDHVAAKLDGYSGFDEGQWRAWLLGHRRELESVTDRLFDVALALARERADDPDHRDERDRLVKKLRGKLERSRKSLEAARDGLSRRFGLDGNTPRVPARLEKFAVNVVRALRADNTTYGGGGLSVDTGELANDIEPLQQELSDKVVELAGEEREAEALLVEREEILEEWERVYRSVAHMLQGAYQLAGEDELADRIRPTIDRASGAEPPEGDEPELDADEESDEDVDDTDQDEDEPEPAGV